MERKPKNKGRESGTFSSEELRVRLQDIVGQSITIDNVETFADSIVNELIALSETVVAQYRQWRPDDRGTGKDIEDRAFTTYGLDDLGSYLERAGEKAEMLRRIGTFLLNVPLIPEVITPPDESARPIPEGSGDFSKEKELVPRLELFLYILQNDFGIPLEDIRLTRGITTSTMMRQESYVTVEIDSLNRIAQICNEEGNVSYIFDKENLRKLRITVSELNRAGKEAKNTMLSTNKGLGVVLRQSPSWRLRVTEYLSSPFDEVVEPEDLPGVITSELDPWHGFVEKRGKHYGSQTRIAHHLGIDRATVSAYVEVHPDIDYTEARDLHDHPRKHYCVEQIEEGLGDFLTSPHTTAEGAWRGFIERNGAHYAPVKRIAGRLGLAQMTVQRYINAHTEIDSIEARDLRGAKITMYSVEQIREAFKNILDLPPAIKTGMWRGFLERDGLHWAPPYTIGRHSGVPKDKIRQFIKKHPELPNTRARSLAGRKDVFYPIERILPFIKLETKLTIDKDTISDNLPR